MGHEGAAIAKGAARSRRRWLSSVRARLIVGYVALGAMLTGIGLFSLSGIYRQSERHRHERGMLREELVRLEAKASAATEESFSYALFRDPEEGARARAKLEDACIAARALHAHVSTVLQVETLSDDIERDACHFRDDGAMMLGSIEQNGQLSSKQYLDFEQTVDGLIDHIVGLDTEIKDEWELDRVSTERNAEIGMLLVGAISVLIAVFWGRRFASSVADPLQKLRRALRTFGHGNLDATIDIDSGDEIGDLARAFREMATSTREHVEALDKAKVHLSDIFASMGELLVVCDADGVILSVNPACVILSGIGRDQLMGKPASLLFVNVPPPADAKATRVHGETELKTRDGGRIPVRLSASRLHGSGGTLLVAENLSERQRLEVELRQAQKMDAIGRLAGGVAHDFNNMLSIILGYSGMLLDGMTDADPNHEAISEIQRAGERSLDLTQQLLSFSRQQSPEVAIVDVNVVLENTTRMMRRTLGSNVQLSISPSRTSCPVRIGAGQMDNMLMNLVLNARDAMPDGGRIDISVDRVASQVVLTVKDNGVGMDAPTMDRIFEPFFTTKPDGEGTGLGLATAFGIVERGGGTIMVDSDVGLGTTFRVFLPHASVALEDETMPQLLQGAA